MPLARILLYVATAGALSLLGRSLLIAPVPLPLAIGALSGYVVFILSGVVVLRLGMFVDVVWRGPREARGVALTFDDGPSPEHTPRILALCAEAKVRATFFVVGRKASEHPELVRAIAEGGHAIGIHSHFHDPLLALRAPDTVGDDLTEAIATVEAITGERPTLFRPPHGLTSPRIARALEWFDLTVVGWSARARARARPEQVAARIVPRLRDGAIVLLHDAALQDDFRPASVDALPRILEAMRARDLAGVRLDRWLGGRAATSRRRARGAPPS